MLKKLFKMEEQIEGHITKILTKFGKKLFSTNRLLIDVIIEKSIFQFRLIELIIEFSKNWPSDPHFTRVK